MGERYIHHPSFGLLYVVCPTVEQAKSLFTTLYAHRLFFVVTERTGEPPAYEAVSRGEARQFVEDKIRNFRRQRDPDLKEDLERLEQFHRQMFS